MTGAESDRPAILVTGGAGYIGSHACKALAASGYLPVALDDLSGGFRDFVRWGPLVEGRVQDGALLRATLARWQPIGALHFAAFIAVGESVREPERYWENNVGGTISLVSALREADIRAMVLSSTAAVYGSAGGDQPLREDGPLAPDNPYGRSKLVAETILQDCGRAHGLNACALRYFNAAGGDPDGEIGESHDPETHLIPLAIDAALGRRGPLSIFGTDYATPDGTALRDYVHVVDLVEAHVAALRRLLHGASTGQGCFEAFNLGSGEGRSVRQIVEAVGEILGRPVPHDVGPRRPGDSAMLVACIDKARQELGWMPRHSDLASIVRDAALWRER